MNKERKKNEMQQKLLRRKTMNRDHKSDEEKII